MCVVVSSSFPHVYFTESPDFKFIEYVMSDGLRKNKRKCLEELSVKPEMLSTIVVTRLSREAMVKHPCWELKT